VTGNFSPLDFAILGLFLAGILALGAWVGRRQPHSDEFLLADRSLSWWPLGLSLGVAGLAAVFYCSAPNEAYFVGLKFLLAPILVWAALPIVLWCIVPLYYNLELDSVYEYLELRFDPTTRAAAGGAYIFWQLLWLGGVLALPCYVLHLGPGLNLPVLAMIVGAGGVVTLYTALGGMKASVLTDVAKVAVMGCAAVVVILTIAAELDEGLPRILEVAENMHRDTVLDTRLGGALWSNWSAYAAIPYLALVPLFFFVADQATLQRFFSARDDSDIKISYLLGSVVMGLMVLAAMYIGLGLLAVYQDNAQGEIPPAWVVNSGRDPATGRRLVTAETAINAETIGELAAQGVILDPNTNEKFEDPDELVNARGEVVIKRLARRSTRLRGGEYHLWSGRDELLARFVARHVFHGLAAVVVAAMAAAAMAVMDSGLIALATLIVIDFHRRFGWAEGWLARQCAKQPDDLDQSDEMRLARPVVAVLGVAVIVIALVVAALGHVVSFVLGTLGIFAGPLLGIFLLGLFTRRTTGPAAVAAMALGAVVAFLATLLSTAPAAAIWPFARPLGIFWPMLLGLAATLAGGYSLSFIVGRRKSRDELSGLVVGLGRPGVLLDVEEEEKDDLTWLKAEEDQSPWS